jgi:hypothetical protein
LHGHRQLVVQTVRLSPATSETHALSCYSYLRIGSTLRGLPAFKWEEGVGDGRSVWPESSGLHAAYNAQNNGLQLRKEKPIPKSALSSDRGLQLTLVKLESLVIAGYHPAVNMSLLLAHTARQVSQALLR